MLGRKVRATLKKARNVLPKTKAPKRHLVTLPLAVGGIVAIVLVLAGLKVLAKKQPTDTDDFLDTGTKQDSPLKTT